MKYTEYQFIVKPLDPWKDILIAYLAELPFESFIDTEDGFLTYVKTDQDNEEQVKKLPILSSSDVQIIYKRKNVPDINWNEEWEKNFSPINIENKIYLHANFHSKKDTIPYQILIQPKMSFGTGHHETTYNMLHAMLSMDFQGKSVLDMGCGTGVLAIFAKMKGAGYVEAIDIDEWSYENSIENAQKNLVEITVRLGDTNILKEETMFDVILANINKNILLQDIKTYSKYLKPQGKLLVSGIYNHDYEDIIVESSKYGLKFEQKWEKNNWISILLNHDL